MAGKAPTTIPGLMEFLRQTRATSPRLVWYGPGRERIELSGKVLDNWVAKTANLLVDELEAEPGDRLDLLMPPHWKTLVWALAAWQTGLSVRTGLAVQGGHPEQAGSEGQAGLAVQGGLPGQGEYAASGAQVPAAAITVTADAGILERTLSTGTGSEGDPGILVAVSLGALDLQWPGDLGSGVLDYAAEIRSHGDVYFAQWQAEPADPALEWPGGSLEYGSLLDRAALYPETAPGQSPVPGAASVPQPGPASVPKPETMLIPAAERELAGLLLQCLQAWAGDGCVVLVSEGVQVTQKLLDSERVSLPHDL